MGAINSGIRKVTITTPFPEGSVNAYVLLGSPVTLVDTGLSSDDSYQQLKQGLSDVGLSLKDLDQIVVTHLHTDHVGGIRAIQREVDIPIYVHERARETLYGGEQEFLRAEGFFHDFIHWCGASSIVTRRRTYREMGWKNVHLVSEGDTVVAGGRSWRVIYVPGHSQTDMCLWDEDSGEAIVGDHLLSEISANAFMEAPPAGASQRLKPLLLFRESMARTRELPFTTIYPGHGDPYAGHRALIDERFAEHEERCEHILSLLREQSRTVYELSCEMFPWLSKSAVFLGLSEIQGHLDLLALRNQVVAKVESGVATYHAYDI